ncbi:Hypothetical predicted protein [Lecanosticta acicola]|uniref:Heterokaryon incompatibility domain-containing protein n=1 Tax=Lecanosticta acicola TaxID=111012 RepID=A0AAI8Z9N7_9PEZI|nr:Hypothetical predicted protein [Lecanosticta acicola]
MTLPVYTADIQDAGGKDAWILKFQAQILKFEPHAELFDADMVFSVKLQSQRFIVYSAEYDEDVQPNVSMKDSTNSEQTFRQIQKWTDTCRNTHPKCRALFRERKDTDWVPTRLIEVSPPDSLHPRVVETNNKVARKFTQYITLSYKWGYTPEYLLKSSNKQEFMKGMVLDKMPQTFRDAIIATRALGVEYVWIDGLCMLQTDPEEFLREAPLMQEVYGNSYLSLAAVSANNNQQGLFRKRMPRGAPPSVTSVNWSRRPTECIVVREDLWKGEILAEPLYARGWVMQERMLAPRIVHFQRRQVFWQCPSLTACEAMPRGLSTVVEDERKDELRWRQLLHRLEGSCLSKDDQADLNEVWRVAVESYTNCNLTKNQDKLMAVAGIAKKFLSVLKDPATGKQEQYYAGLWGFQFAEQLAWRVVEWLPLAPKDEATYRAPSWSWASADGIIRTPRRIFQRRDYCMKIGEGGVNVHLADARNPTGVVYFASLTAEVELFRHLKFSATDQSSLEWQWIGVDGAPFRLLLDRPLDKFPPDPNEDVKIGPVANGSGYHLECSAAMIAYQRDLDGTSDYSGFALALSKARAGKTRLFGRLGLIEFRGLSGDDWKGLEQFKETEKREEGEVAPSDNRAGDKHLITLL